MISQNEILRTIAGLRSIRQEPPFVDQMQRAPQSQQNFSQQYQHSQQEPPLERTSQPAIPPLHRAPSRGESHSQIRETAESQQSTSLILSSIDAEPPMFLLPVYTNELGNFPLHGQVTFSTQGLKHKRNHLLRILTQTTGIQCRVMMPRAESHASPGFL